MARSSSFADVLRAERERTGMSLRGLALSAGLNPGYLSRLESGQIEPQFKNAVALADALAGARNDTVAAREELRRRLAEAAGRVPKDKMVVAETRERFRELLQARGLQPKQIAAALEAVSLATMLCVLSGKEPLDIMPIGALSDPNARLNLDQEVVVLPESEHQFPAGPRASIEVRGSLTREQRQQISLIAQLLSSVLSKS